MASLETKKAAPGQTAVLALLCLAGLVSVVLIGILPSVRELQSCEAAIRKLQDESKQQAILRPALAELEVLAKRARPTALTAPQRGRLKADQLPTLANQFSSLAKASGLELVYAVPEAKSLESGTQRVLVKLLAQGPVAQYRSLILALIGTPFVDHIDQVAIQRSSPAEELRVEMWLAIE